MEYKSPMLDQLQDWAKKQAESTGYRTVGVYAGALGWGYNTTIFKDKGYKEPLCWADLLAPELKGEIQIANPNSSGTAYTALASLVQIMGEDQAIDYLKKLNANISQYTKSGSAPVKAAARGETALGIVFMHDAVAQTAEGFPIKSIAPCEGTGYEIGSMSIIKGARNLENAKVCPYTHSTGGMEACREGKLVPFIQIHRKQQEDNACDFQLFPFYSLPEHPLGRFLHRQRVNSTSSARQMSLFVNR